MNTLQMVLLLLSGKAGTPPAPTTQPRTLPDGSDRTLPDGSTRETVN